MNGLCTGARLQATDKLKLGISSILSPLFYCAHAVRIPRTFSEPLASVSRAARDRIFLRSSPAYLCEGCSPVGARRGLLIISLLFRKEKKSRVVSWYIISFRSTFPITPGGEKERRDNGLVWEVRVSLSSSCPALRTRDSIQPIQCH